MTKATLLRLCRTCPLRSLASSPRPRRASFPSSPTARARAASSGGLGSSSPPTKPCPRRASSPSRSPAATPSPRGSSDATPAPMSHCCASTAPTCRQFRLPHQPSPRARSPSRWAPRMVRRPPRSAWCPARPDRGDPCVAARSTPGSSLICACGGAPKAALRSMRLAGDRHGGIRAAPACARHTIGHDRAGRGEAREPRAHRARLSRPRPPAGGARGRRRIGRHGHERRPSRTRRGRGRLPGGHHRRLERRADPDRCNRCCVRSGRTASARRSRSGCVGPARAKQVPLTIAERPAA